MTFLKFFLRPRSLALAVLAIVLAACTVVVDEGPGPRPRPPYPGPGPQFCTREYEPVCARRGGDRQTFANACMARREGYRVIGNGQCRGGGWDDGGDRPQFCTREYAPVCARRYGQLQTFPNGCEARAAGWRIVDDGPC